VTRTNSVAPSYGCVNCNNIGITPSTGEVGVVIELSNQFGLTDMECEKLTEMIKV